MHYKKLNEFCRQKLISANTLAPCSTWHKTTLKRNSTLTLDARAAQSLEHHKKLEKSSPSRFHLERTLASCHPACHNLYYNWCNICGRGRDDHSLASHTAFVAIAIGYADEALLAIGLSP